MTDKEKLIKLKKLADAMYYAAQYLTTDASKLHKAMDEYHKFIIHECKEEPVSEELEEASKEWLIPQLDKSYANYGEVKMMELTHFDGYAMLDAIEFGAKWQEAKDQEIIETAIHHAYHNGRLEMKEKMMAKLWKPADGDELPEYEREVVAFQEIFPTDVDVPSLLKIVIAHRPNPEGYDGKSITTGQVEHYTPKTYDKGGWNIPNIKYWLDVELPKEIEL